MHLVHTLHSILIDLIVHADLSKCLRDWIDLVHHVKVQHLLFAAHVPLSQFYELHLLIIGCWKLVLSVDGSSCLGNDI